MQRSGSRISKRIGARGSPLALVQAEKARDLIAAAAGVSPDEREAVFPVVALSTAGDRIQDRKLSEAGGKGLFTKELEEALADGRIDIAVHSMKDVPTRPPESLTLAAILEREDPRDAFISNIADHLDALPQGAKLGTASLRRQAQALARRPDLEIVMFRGNVGTRLDKLARGVADATFLAAAGLSRLAQSDVATSFVDPEVMLPAAAQGALGLQTRADDAEAIALCTGLEHAESAICIAAERGFLDALDGSCRTPIAALAELGDASLRLRAEALTEDGAKRWSRDETCAIADADAARAFGQQIGAAIREEAGDALGWAG
ncbi:MAG: hydroxymethylbilane synthase [Maricaulaceae bacterium]|jgi:hydroxymethylbilane synthase